MLPDLVYSDNDDSDSDYDDYITRPGMETGRTVRRPSDVGGVQGRRRGDVSAQPPPVLDLDGGAGQQQEPSAAPLPAAPPAVRNVREEHLRATAQQAANLADRGDTWRRVPANGGEAAHEGQGPGLVREVAGGNGDQVPLEELIDPEVPGPHPGPVPEDAQGWNMIDQWGVWDCTLCVFPTMQNVPRVYREVWASAVSKILLKIQSAEEGIELERGLKWLLIIPKAVFRQGRRGGKAGKGLLARRINMLVMEDWGGLLALLGTDCRQAKADDQQERHHREISEEAQLERKRKNALLLLSKGFISKAARTITSFGIGSMDDPNILHQMEQKYPRRGIPLPASVSRSQCVDNLRGLRDMLLGLQGGVSAGTGGMRPEYLTCLAEVWGEEQMSRLENFGMRYLTGLLPAWWYKVWLSLTTVALFKTSEQEAVRPVGIEPCLARSFHKMVNRENKAALVNFLEPQQLALSVAGGAKLVHSVRMLSEANPTHVVVKTDISNAFNSVSRACILDVLEGEESLRHLSWHAALTLASPNALESGGTVWGQAREGGTQGNPEAGSWFCVAWQPQIRRLDAELSAVGGAAKAGMDDLFAIGPPEVVFPALERFCQDIKDKCLLQLERSKTEVFTWDGILPAATPEGFKKAGITVGDQFLPGFLCYGIPVGSPGYVRHQLSLKVQDIGREVEMSLKVLENEGHAVWTIARSSTATKLDYHLSLVYPTDMEAAAKEMDNLLWHMLEKAAGFCIPRVDQGRGVECSPNPPVQRLHGRSYQELSVRTPVRLGGMGYRSVAETSLPAFLGGVEQALSHFTGEGGVCAQLAGVVGNLQNSANRWRDLLTSGCRTGEEFT